MPSNRFLSSFNSFQKIVVMLDTWTFRLRNWWVPVVSVSGANLSDLSCRVCVWSCWSSHWWVRGHQKNLEVRWICLSRVRGFRQTTRVWKRSIASKHILFQKWGGKGSSKPRIWVLSTQSWGGHPECKREERDHSHVAYQELHAINFEGHAIRSFKENLSSRFKAWKHFNEQRRSR